MDVVFYCLGFGRPLLKGTNRQHSGHIGHKFSN